MKHSYAYFILCLKKALKSYKSIIVTTVLLVVALFLTAQMLLNMNKNDESRQRVKIGLTGDIEETFMGIGFSTIEKMDDLGLSIEFVEMEEAEAEKALKNFDISAYIVVPENYIDDIISGRDAQVTFVMQKTSAVASGVLMSEFVKILSPIITQSESGIYGVIDYAEDMDVSGVNKYIDNINIKYIDTVLSRSNMIELDTIGINSLSMTEYYVCGIITFFLLIFAISCCPLFSDKNLSLGRLLSSKGVGTTKLILCEYASYTIIVWVTVFILTIGLSLLGLGADIGFDASWFLKIAFTLTPCILMVASLQFFIYEITKGIVAGVLAQFISAVAMGYLSGCFYPYYFFPEVVQNIAAKLPSGIVFEFLRESVVGRSHNVILVSLLYTLVFLALSCLVRNYRLRRDTL